MRIITLFLITLPSIIFGQKNPVNISLFNEATAIPFTRFISTPIHPGLQLGTEFNYRAKERSRLFQTATICYFYHNHLAQGIGISSELGYEKSIGTKFTLEGLIGLGYMHTFATTEEFVFSNGQYKKKPDRGNSRLYPSLSLSTGYYFKKSDKKSPKIFLRYQSWIEYPYSPDFIPLMTHINLHIGARIFLYNKTKDE